MNPATIALAGLLLLPATRPGSGQNSDCARGAAGPVLKKSVYPKAQFQLQSDRRTGSEKVSFANGDQLIIRNWGCESYVLTFRFETSRFPMQPTAPWYRRCATLMTELLPGLDVPLDLKGGVAALSRAADQQKTRVPSEEISYGNDTALEFVTVDKVQPLAGGRYAIVVSFARLL